MYHNKFIPTPKMIGYLIKFPLRIFAFVTMLVLYINDKKSFYEYTTAPIWDGLNFMHIMWCIFMGFMMLHLFPTDVLSMGAGKSRSKNYVPVPDYSVQALDEFVKSENRKARNCMIVWLAGNAVIALLYFIGIIGTAELLLFTGFYFICDYICIVIFCPFQTIGMKNRCCVNCRIYDWGHFMMFTPMILLGTFYGLSLFLMGTAVIIHWEYFWRKYPERFWYGSNQTLSCKNCKDKTCQIKKAVRNSLLKNK